MTNDASEVSMRDKVVLITGGAGGLGRRHDVASALSSWVGWPDAVCTARTMLW